MKGYVLGLKNKTRTDEIDDELIGSEEDVLDEDIDFREIEN